MILMQYFTAMTYVWEPYVICPPARKHWGIENHGVKPSSGCSLYPLVNQHTYGKSPFSMGKSTIYTWPFSIAMLVYQRVVLAD